MNKIYKEYLQNGVIDEDNAVDIIEEQGKEIERLNKENKELKDGINKIIEFINNLHSGTKENFIIYGGYEVKEYLKELIKSEYRRSNKDIRL